MTEDNQVNVDDIRNIAEFLVEFYKDTGKFPFYIFAYNPETGEVSEFFKNEDTLNRAMIQEILKSPNITNSEYLNLNKKP